MLNDLRKMVGIKSDEELEAKRYERSLQDRQETAAEEYFALGGLHQKAGDKKAAIDAFLNAANLALKGTLREQPDREKQSDETRR